MKDLFKHFNDIDIDPNEYEEVEVSEFEKAKFKRDLKEKIAKPSSKKWMKSVAAICFSFSIGLISLIGLSYTTFADDIPIVGSIFKFFSSNQTEKVLSGYEEFSTPQNIVVEHNGTTITVHETVFDSKKFLIGYSVETNQDLGDFALVDAQFIVNDGEKALFNEEHYLRKVGKNRYVGLSTAILPLKVAMSEGTFEFQVKSLSNIHNTKVIQGDWAFKIFEEATKTTIQPIEEASSTKDEFGVEIQQITYTPISFLVNYKETNHNEALNEQYGIIYSEIIARDDLGNTYRSRFNGGFGPTGEIEYLITFERIHPEAKTLTFTPQFIMKDSDNIYEVKETIELDDITINIQK